jgi:hypothetical protein
MSFTNDLLCGLCGEVVKVTHPMQTIEAQMVQHLRAGHNQTVKEAKKLTYLWLKADGERRMREAHPFLSTISPPASPCGKSCRGHKVKKSGKARLSR